MGTEMHLAVSGEDDSVQNMVTAMVVANAEKSKLDAGLTYWLQFIAHDFVPGRSQQISAHGQYQYALNLNSVYGNFDEFVYEFFPEKTGFLDETGRFRFDATRPWDLPRNSVGKAIIPEARNDINIIVAQLHRVVQRVHNALIDDGVVQDALQARRLVTRLYHALVVDYVMRKVLEPKVYKLLFEHNEDVLTLDSNNIPHFFTHGAYRFGHSMVRSFYTLSEQAIHVDLKKLVNPGVAIPGALKINWRFLFNNGEASPALAIDTDIAIAMQSVPVKSLCQRNAVVNVVENNINAAIRKNLPGGIEFVRQWLASDDGANGDLLATLGLTEVSSLDGSNLSEFNLETLPLWPYLLAEAELQQGGYCLGVLGSVMVGQVIKQALKNSRYSLTGHTGYERERLLHCLPPELSELLYSDGDLTKPMDFMKLHVLLETESRYV